MFNLRPPRQKPFLGTPIDMENPLSRGLVGAWIMNEGSGDRVYDSTQNQQNGVFNGNNTDWRNSGVLLGASQDRIIIPITSRINNAFGMVAFSFTPNWNYNDGNVHYIFDTYGGANERFILWKNTNDTLDLYTQTVSRGTIVYTFEANKKYSIVVTWPDNKVYINGIESLDGTDADLGNGSSTLYLGDRYIAANQSLDGTFHYFYLFNTIGTLQEIEQLHIDPYQMWPDYALWIVATELSIPITPIILQTINLISSLTKTVALESNLTKNINLTSSLAKTVALKSQVNLREL